MRGAGRPACAAAPGAHRAAGRHNRRAWGLPKGHLEPGEDAAALREVREETGRAGEILEPLGAVTYQFAKPGGGATVSKRVDFFLMRALSTTPSHHDAGEVVEVRWVALDQALGLMAYENERRILEQTTRRLGQAEVAARIPDDPPT